MEKHENCKDDYLEKLIGGELCKDKIDPRLLPVEGQRLSPYEMDGLWRIFQKIGSVWGTLPRYAPHAENLKSSWLEFIEAKTGTDPSYAAEYSNAVSVVDELIEIYGEEEAFPKLFLDNGIPQNGDGTPKGFPETRLEHAKRYVVDEFIRVNIVASGFKSFGPDGGRGENYKGYIGGSRYTLEPRVRAYDPERDNL